MVTDHGQLIFARQLQGLGVLGDGGFAEDFNSVRSRTLLQPSPFSRQSPSAHHRGPQIRCTMPFSCEGVGNLRGHSQRIGERQRAFVEPLRQRVAVDELEYESGSPRCRSPSRSPDTHDPRCVSQLRSGDRAAGAHRAKWWR